jgi:hypothetical protein
MRMGLGASTRMSANMTVAEIFRKAGLSPRGPVRWETQVPDSSAGVYVVARVGNPASGCEACAVAFIDPIPADLTLDLEYETQRWLANEPVLYVGKTDQPIRKRVGQFYRHKCGDRSPHAGGQVVKLLRCDRWVYWAPAASPYETEQTMIAAFREQAGQRPFANEDGKRPARVGRSL